MSVCNGHIVCAVLYIFTNNIQVSVKNSSAEGPFQVKKRKEKSTVGCHTQWSSISIELLLNLHPVL